MDRILLVLDHKENRRLLAEWLGPRYQLILGGEQALDEPFDLCILDGPALDRLWKRVEARKAAEQSVFLPFLLVTARKDVRHVTRHLWRTVDELILTPIERVELQARVEILLRARRLSLQMQAEAIEQLRASEERYRYISEVAFDYLYAFRVEPDGTTWGEWVSESFVRVFGYTIPEIDARGGWQSMVYPDDLPIAIEHARKVIGGESDICEMRFVTRNGEARWLRDYAKPVVDEASGRVVRIYGASQDITERKRAEEARARSRRVMLALSQAAQAVHRARTPEAVYQAIGEQASSLGFDTAIFTLSDDGEHLILSFSTIQSKLVRAAEKLTSLSAKGYRFPLRPGSFFHKIIAGKEAAFRHVEAHIIAEALPPPVRPLAGRLLDLFGWQQAIYAPLVIGDTVQGLLTVTGTDLTEADVPAVAAFANQAAIALENARLNQETQRLVDQIREQARQVEQILATVPQGVLLLDGEGRVLHANPVARKDLAVLAGAKEGDVLTHLGDRPLSELLTSPPVKGLWHEVRADGRTFEVIARPTAAEQWVVVINDVTQERQVQAQLQRQERLAAVGQLAGGIAHDFNNLMAVIVLYARMLARSEGLSQRDREAVETIYQQAWHATRLIEQILDFSRRAALERRPIDLLPLVKEQVKLLERTLPEDIEVVLTHGEEAYVVNADLTRMQQVLMNLALNARDAMPKGGTLHIDLGRIEVKPGESPPLPGMEAGEWVRLRVSDTGTGIPSEVLPHIFDPFFTTKPPGEGTGLGLAQVDGIVSQHGGHIGVETEVGKGATFTIYLPALTVPSAEPPPPEASELPRGRGEVVLVVEDDEAVRAALVETLEQLNYRVLEAANGEEALAVMEEQEEQVAVVLSDVVMPVMGGIRLFHALRERGWEVPVVLLTGHAMDQDLEELRAQGLSAWLTKPPSVEHLAQTIARVLSR